MRCQLTVTLATRMAEHMFTTPAEAMTFFLILAPPISAPITNALVPDHLAKTPVKMMLAMTVLMPVESEAFVLAPRVLTI